MNKSIANEDNLNIFVKEPHYHFYALLRCGKI